MNRSFIDILNEEIGKQELHNKASEPAFENLYTKTTFTKQNESLLFELKSFRFKPSTSYSKAQTANETSAPKNTHEPAPEKTEYGHFVNCTDLNDIKLFLGQWGERLPEPISKKQLKRLYRKMALKLHPDTTGGSAKAFVHLKKCFDQLESSWQAIEDEAA